jgi:hypothetical protein
MHLMAFVRMLYRCFARVSGTKLSRVLGAFAASIRARRESFQCRRNKIAALARCSFSQ